LQKLAARINGTILAKIIASFIILTGTRHIFAGIDSTGFKLTHASEYYYTKRAKLRRRKYTKLSIGADLLQQIICNIKIRRAPTRHDNIDFKPLVKRIANIIPLSVVTADKTYDSEDNHLLVRELHAFSVIPARYEHVPVWRAHGKYMKQMKCGYSKLLYNQRNKDETIISVIKRLFGEYIILRLVRTQDRELSFRCIAYNTHRSTNLTIIRWFLQSQCVDIYQSR